MPEEAAACWEGAVAAESMAAALDRPVVLVVEVPALDLQHHHHPVGSSAFNSTNSLYHAIGDGNVDLYSAYRRNISKALRYSMHCQGISQFSLHNLHFIRKRNQPYMHLPSQPQLVLIYRPRSDGKMSMGAK